LSRFKFNWTTLDVYSSMQDQKIKELIKDLASVGLSSNPQFLTVGEEGIVKIVRNKENFEKILDEFPLIKGMDTDFHRENENLIFRRDGGPKGLYYFLVFESEQKAKEALIRVTNYLNS
jgi:hypothetical protein